MARINLEDEFFISQGWFDLLIKLGDSDTALGAIVRAWKLAQTYWVPARKRIPREKWEKEKIREAILEVDLADENEDGIYVHGSDEQFKWLMQRHVAGNKGGRPKKKPGVTGGNRIEPGVTVSNRLEPSSSSSFSFSKKEEEPNVVFKTAKEDLDDCVTVWGKTLEKFNISKDPRLDDAGIVQLLRTHGVEKVKLALAGQKHEKGSQSFDPSDNISIQRLILKSAIFDKLVNLGAKHTTKPKQPVKPPTEAEIVRADPALVKDLMGKLKMGMK